MGLHTELRQSYIMWTRNSKMLAVFFLSLDMSSLGHHFQNAPWSFGFDPSSFANKRLDKSLVEGRYRLKHYKFDGLEEVLKAYGVDEEGIRSIREATIITSVSVVETGEVEISTMALSSPEEANKVMFSLGEETQITNPLNGEQIKFLGTALSSSVLQTRSVGLQSNTTEIKTWQFNAEGAVVTV